MLFSRTQRLSKTRVPCASPCSYEEYEKTSTLKTLTLKKKFRYNSHQKLGKIRLLQIEVGPQHLGIGWGNRGWVFQKDKYDRKGDMLDQRERRLRTTSWRCIFYTFKIFLKCSLKSSPGSLICDDSCCLISFYVLSSNWGRFCTLIIMWGGIGRPCTCLSLVYGCWA